MSVSFRASCMYRFIKIIKDFLKSLGTLHLFKNNIQLRVFFSSDITNILATKTSEIQGKQFTCGGRLGGVLIRGVGPIAEAAFKLLSLSSWYMRSLSASGSCKKFCIARRFTSRDCEAVLGSSSFRRISESKPCKGKERKKKNPTTRTSRYTMQSYYNIYSQSLLIILFFVSLTLESMQ